MIPRWIRIGAIGVAAVGTISVCTVILLGMRPEEKPRKLTSIDISTLAPGKWTSIDSDRLRFFVVRPAQAEPYALATPLYEGKVPLPEVYWFKPYMNCTDFGLDMPNGIVDSDARFRCRDANLPEDWAKRWQWDARGKHIPNDAGKIDNLYGVRIAREDDIVSFVGLEPD